jgi:uncharacterized protein YndB with AHSA1/START domain
MIAHKETTYKKDLDNKKIFAEREFDAPVEKVWKAWTEAKLLDQWWAPKPWKAVTKSMDFRDGGTWYYYMQGPEGERHYCRADFTNIDPKKSFEGDDAFTDENGKPNGEMPSMHWSTMFNKTDDGTKVNVEVSFKSVEDLEKIVEMGFQEGFASAHNNLDELLASE